MVGKKEQFMLALKGWRYKGVLEDWRYGVADLLGPVPYYGFSDKDGEGVGTYIPGTDIIKKEHTQKHIILFLADHTYYELGDKRNEN